MDIEAKLINNIIVYQARLSSLLQPKWVKPDATVQATTQLRLKSDLHEPDYLIVSYWYLKYILILKCYFLIINLFQNT